MNTAAPVAVVADDLELERLLVERGARAGVAHVENGVVQAANGSHGASQPPQSLDDSRKHFHEPLDVGVGARPAHRDPQRVVGIDSHRGEHRRRLERLRRARRSRVHGHAVLVEREQDRLGFDAAHTEAQHVGQRRVASCRPKRSTSGTRSITRGARLDQRSLRRSLAVEVDGRARGAEPDPRGDVLDPGRGVPAPARRPRGAARTASPRRTSKRTRALRTAELVRGDRTEIGVERVKVDRRVARGRARVDVHDDAALRAPPRRSSAAGCTVPTS